MKELFCFMLILLVSVIGCSTENPLCTDNYCVTGEIFPKSELEEGQSFEVLPIDESALVVAIDAATVQDGDVVRRPKIEETTPEEWKTMIEEQGELPALELITVTNTLRIQVADRTPELCVSLNDDVIEGVSYTAHRSTWIRQSKSTQQLDFLERPSVTYSFEIIESTISEGEICSIKATEIKSDYVKTDEFFGFNILSTEYTHRLVIDMTVDGLRQLWVSPTTISRD